MIAPGAAVSIGLLALAGMLKSERLGGVFVVLLMGAWFAFFRWSKKVMAREAEEAKLAQAATNAKEDASRLAAEKQEELARLAAFEASFTTCTQCHERVPKSFIAESLPGSSDFGNGLMIPLAACRHCLDGEAYPADVLLREIAKES